MSEEGLSRFSLLSELSPEDLEALEPHLEHETFRAGRQLFREGQEADGLWLLDRGRVRFESKRVDDLGCAAAGSALGAMSLVTVGSREVTAVAEEEAEVRKLSRTAFHRLIEDAPRAACRILEGVLRDTASALREGLGEGKLR